MLAAFGFALSACDGTAASGQWSVAVAIPRVGTYPISLETGSSAPVSGTEQITAFPDGRSVVITGRGQTTETDIYYSGSFVGLFSLKTNDLYCRGGGFLVFPPELRTSETWDDDSYDCTASDAQASSFHISFKGSVEAKSSVQLAGGSVSVVNVRVDTVVRGNSGSVLGTETSIQSLDPTSGLVVRSRASGSGSLAQAFVSYEFRSPP